MPQTSGGTRVNFDDSLLDREKFSKSKKRLEMRKSEKLASALERFDKQTHVEVVCVNQPGSVVKVLASQLELEDEERLVSSLQELIAAYPRYRADFRGLVDIIREKRF